jgi:hypothetical protein
VAVHLFHNYPHRSLRGRFLRVYGAAGESVQALPIISGSPPGRSIWLGPVVRFAGKCRYLISRCNRAFLAAV